MTNLTNLTKQLRCNLYVDFGTDLESAFNAANILAGASREPAAVFTALYGVVNTLCNVIEAECEVQAQQLTRIKGTLQEASVVLGELKKYVEVQDAQEQTK